VQHFGRYGQHGMQHLAAICIKQQHISGGIVPSDSPPCRRSRTPAGWCSQVIRASPDCLLSILVRPQLLRLEMLVNHLCHRQSALKTHCLTSLQNNLHSGQRRSAYRHTTFEQERIHSPMSDPVIATANTAAGLLNRSG